MTRDVTPLPKQGPKPKKPRRGRAEPDRPMALRCELGLDGCTGAATDRHHRLRRGQGGTDGPENTLDLCWTCHHVGVHGNPSRAYEQGWMIRGTGVLRRPLDGV